MSPCASSDLEKEKSPPSSLMPQVFRPSTLSHLQHCLKSPGSQSLDLPVKSGPAFCGSSAAKSWLSCRSTFHTLHFSLCFPVSPNHSLTLFSYSPHTSFCYGCQSKVCALSKGNYNSPLALLLNRLAITWTKAPCYGFIFLLGLAQAESGFPHTIVQPLRCFIRATRAKVISHDQMLQPKV